ncbi:MAG: filamentous hemagglutinin N-terminal domain-containing protein [Candidatus Omnitrophica bacterium]|nr:filamentous hemagglutinin N-terminal domain-containing protein [Candidatus Omnitrophota bacterium]
MKKSFFSLQKCSKNFFSILFIITLISLYPASSFGGDLPEGPNVQIGNPTITTEGNDMLIDAGSHSKTWIDWTGGFNIGVQNLVNNLGPSRAAAILHNDISGNISNIQGVLNGNCNVFLLNANGILFSSTAQVNVGSLVASTLTISQEDFLDGNYVLTADGQTLGTVINQGTISALEDGSITLAGGAVKNLGTIDVNLGTVNLVSGNQITLDVIGNGNIQAAVNQGLLDNVYDQDGNKVEVGVENIGEITADGGKIYMEADAISGVFDQLVNQEGIVRAGSLVEENGQIVLRSDSEGIVQNTGTITVSGVEDGASGGEVEMTGNLVGQFGEIRADGMGQADGGDIDIYAESAVALNSDSLTTANAGTVGDGGEIIIYSPKYALFWPDAQIGAKGGTISGDGGFVEVSGKEDVEVYGLVDTSAADGASGTFLIDPYNITIADSANVNLDDNDDYFIPSGSGCNIYDNYIETALETNDVVINTSGIAGGHETGNITIIDRVEWTENHSLTLIADGDIIFDEVANLACFDLTGGTSNDLTLTAAGSIYSNTGGNLDINMGSGDLTMSAGTGIGTSGTYIEIEDLSDLSATTDSGGIYIHNHSSSVSAVVINELTATSGDIAIIDDESNITVSSPVIASGGSITFTTDGYIDINYNLTSADSITLDSSGGGTIYLNGNIESTDGTVQFTNDQVTVDGNSIVSSTSGDVTFGGAVLDSANDTHTLEVNANNGTATFTGAVGNGATDLNALTVTAGDTVFSSTTQVGTGGLTVTGVGTSTTTISGDVTSASDVLYDDSVILGDDADHTITIDTTANNSSVEITGKMDGTSANTQSLDIEAGSGAVTLGDSIGTTTTLHTLQIDTSGQTELNGAIRVGENLDLDEADDVQLGSDVTATVGNSATLQAIDGGFALNIDAENNITANSSIGATEPLTALTFDAADYIIVNGAVTSTGTVLMQTGGATGDDITINSAVSANSVTLDGDEVNVNAPITGTNEINITAQGSSTGDDANLAADLDSASVIVTGNSNATIQVTSTQDNTLGSTTYNAASTLGANVTAADDLTFNGAVTLSGGARTLTSTNGDIDLNANVLGAQNLTLAADNGAIYATTIGVGTPVSALVMSSNTAEFAGNITAASVDTTGVGITNLVGPVTITASSNSAGTAINLGQLAGDFMLTLDATDAADGDVIVNAANIYSLILQDAVDVTFAQDFHTNGPVTVDTAITGTITVNGSIVADGLVTLENNDTVNNAGIDINGAVTGVAGVTMAATTGNVAIDADVSASGAGLIDIDATAGNVNIAQASASTISSVNGEIDLLAGTSILLGAAGQAGEITTTGSGNIDLNATTAFTMTNASSKVTSGGTIDIDPDTVTITGSGLEAAGNITVDATDTITVNGVVNSTSGSTALTVTNADGDNGLITVNANLIGDDVTVTVSDSSGPVETIDVTSAINNNRGGITFEPNDGTLDIDSNVSAQDFITLNGAAAITLAADLTATDNNIDVNDALTLDGDSTVTATSGNVAFDSTVGGAQSLTVSSASGTTTFSSTIGVVTDELTALTVSANIANIGGNIFTDGGATADVDFTGTNTVVLTTDVTIDTETGDGTAAGDVLFKPAGTINGTTASTEFLAIDAGVTGANDGGDVQLGIIGDTTSLQYLTVDNASGSAIDGTTTLYGNITTAGAITMTDANDIDLAGNVTMTTTDSAVDLGTGDNIDGAYNLIIDAGSGAVTLGRIGAATDISGLTVTSGSLTSADQVEVDGALTVTASGAVDIDGAIDVDGESGDVSIATSSTLALDADLTVDGASTVTLDSGASAMTIGTASDSTVTGVNGDINMVAGDLTLGTGANDGIITTAGGGGNIKIDSTGALTISDTDADASKIDSGGYLDIDPTTVDINGAGLEADEYITVTASGAVTNNAGILTTDTDSYVTIDAGSIAQLSDITTPTSGAEYVTLISDAAITDTNNSTTDITTRTLNINDATTVGATGVGNELDTDIAFLNMSDVSGASYILEDDGITLSDLDVDGLLNIEATLGDITATSITTSNDNVTLVSTAAAITVGSIDAGSGTATLDADTTINDASADATTDIIASTIDLDSSDGIGETNALELSGTTISADTDGLGAASIDLNNDSASATTVSSLTTAGDEADITFDQTGEGSVSFTTVTTVDGDISLSSNDSNLTNSTSITAGDDGNIILTTTTSGDITLTGTTTADGDDITIDSAGSINGAGLVTASIVDMDAAIGIGSSTALELAATTITADSSTSGDLDIDNTLATDVTVPTLTTATGGNITFDQAGGGNITFNQVSTAADSDPIDGEADISLTNTAGSLTVSTLAETTGQGDVTLDADGQNSDVTVGGDINLVDGETTITADDSVTFSASGNITSTGSGNVSVTSNTTTTDGDSGDDITQADGSVIDAGSGTITLTSTGTNAGSITIAGLTTTNSTSSAVTVDTAASVVDAGDTNVDIVANSTGAVTDIDAVTGIGSGAALETTIAGLEAYNSTSGNIEISETDGLLIRNITQALDGSIDVTTAGDTTVVAALGGVTANNPAADGDSISISVGGDGSLTVNDGISVYNGPINLTVDNDINFGADGDIDSANGGAGGAITVTADNDSDNDGSGGAITMTDGALIDAGNSTIDIDADEDITLGGLLTTNATLSAVAITSTNGAIIDGGSSHTDIDANTDNAVVTIDALTGVGTDDALDISAYEINVDNNTSSAKSAVGDIRIIEIDGSGDDSLRIAKAVVLDPTGPEDGDINIQTTAGDLTVSGALTYAVDTAQDGSITLDANGVTSTLTVNDGVRSVDGNITLTADDDVIFGGDGDIVSTTGDVTITADNDSGAGGTDGALTMADGTVIDAGSGDIALNADENITLGGLTTTSSENTAVVLTTTNGGIVDGGNTDVDVVAIDGRLVIDAVTGVGSADAIDTTVSSIDIDNTTSGNIDINETDAISVIEIDQDAAVGTVNLDAGSTITVVATADGGSANGVTSVGGQVELDANGTTSDILVNNVITTTSGTINIYADDDVTFTNVGDVTSGGAGNVNVTADADDSGTGIGGALFMADVDDDSTIIDAGTGVITLLADEDITLGGLTTANTANSSVIITTDNGSIVDGGDTAVDIDANTTADTSGARLTALTGIGTDADDIDTTIETLSATTTTGDIHINNTGELDIIDDTVVNGAQITGGSVGDNITILASSPLNVDADVIDAGGGDILLAAEGTTISDDLTINDVITASGGNGNIDLYAGHDILQVSGDITAAGSGQVNLYAGVDYNSGTAQAGHATGDITQSDGQTISSTSGNITMTATEDVNLSHISTGGDVSITADDDTYSLADNSGAITDNPADDTVNITAVTATLRAATGIGSADDIETIITALDALNTTSGNIQVYELAAGTDLNVNQATQQTAGNIDIQTENGTLTVIADQSGVTTVGAGTITLIAGDSDNDYSEDLAINDTVTSASGLITLTSSGDDITFGAGGDVTSTSGNVDVNAESGAGLGEGVITMTDGAVIDSGTGQIDMDAYGDITLGGLTTTYTADDAVAVTSVAGGIVDGGDTDVDIVANTASATVDLDAETGIGTDNALETSIYNLDAANGTTSATSSNIKINETDAINLVSVINKATGSIDVEAAGTITTTIVTAEAGAVNLYATAGDILDNTTGTTLITAGADSSLKASGVIGSAVGPHDPVDVNIDGELWVWAGSAEDGVSAILQGTVNTAASTERVEIYNPSPPGLVIFNNHLMGGGNYGSGSSGGSILSQGYGTSLVVLSTMFDVYPQSALQGWGFGISQGELINEDLLTGPSAGIDGSSLGITGIPSNLAIPVYETTMPQFYIIRAP